MFEHTTLKDEKEAILTIVKEAMKLAGGVTEARVKVLPLPSSGFPSSPPSQPFSSSSSPSLSSLLSPSSISSLISSLSLSLSKKCDGQMKRCFYDSSSLPTMEKGGGEERQGEEKRVYGEGRVVMVDVRKMTREVMNVPFSSSSSPSSPNLLKVDRAKKGGMYMEMGETGFFFFLFFFFFFFSFNLSSLTFPQGTRSSSFPFCLSLFFEEIGPSPHLLLFPLSLPSLSPPFSNCFSSLSSFVVCSSFLVSFLSFPFC